MGINEIWKDITGYEGLYKASNYGNILSVQRHKINRTIRERILKKDKGKNGYFCIYLSKNGKVKKHLIHRIVAMTFIPNPENLPQVNHKDENKSNNYVGNLEWCTCSYNSSYGTINQRRTAHTNYYSSANMERHKRDRIPVMQLSRKLELINVFESLSQAAVKTNTPIGTICRCCRGKGKTAGGYIWKYKEA
ncbi:MAG: HNH endonuclease [Treponema sp.]|jgi:hypothetical protein|nr:HNH endonuclease [Treponema sp.]